MADDLLGVEIGGWVVGKLLGNGASALVFASTKGGLEGALKVVDPEIIERFGLEEQRARVQRERDLMGHGHPNLIEVLDGGICEMSGHLFLVMALLGQERYMPLSKALPELHRDRIALLIQQLAGAARFLLEKRGVVHRDIKPDNIMITRDHTHAILLDLGVALPLLVLEDAGTGDAFVGTTRYSPPEFISRDEEQSPKGWCAVTFYQLGAVLHDMIMRRPMFHDVQAPSAKVIDAVRHEKPLVNADDVDPHLLSLARNCLEKDWHLRLNLVTWESFDGALPANDSVSVRKRIQQRMAADSRVFAIPNSPPGSNRRLLERAGAAVSAVVGEVRQRSEVFPPIEVRHEVSDGISWISVKAGPWPKPRLPVVFEVCLRVEVLDNLGAALRIKGSAALGRQARGQDAAAWTEIYLGEASSPGLFRDLDAFLHQALHSALDMGEPSPGGTYLHVPR